MSPNQLTATIIWFAIFSGLFVILFFVGGGISALQGEFQIRSFPLMLLGIVPLIVGMAGRVILPTKESDQQFQTALIILLAICEAPALVGLLVYPDAYVTERGFAFVGAVLGVLVLCPLTIKRNAGARE